MFYATQMDAYKDNSEKQRFEALIDGKVVAFAEYRAVGQNLMLTHTEVNPELEGQGVGGGLIKFALTDIRNKELSAIPMCPFVKSYIKRHPEYLDVVNPEHRHIFNL
jgi:predicted GNAT family acetyltransferase